MASNLLHINFDKCCFIHFNPESYCDTDENFSEEINKNVEQMESALQQMEKDILNKKKFKNEK